MAAPSCTVQRLGDPADALAFATNTPDHNHRPITGQQRPITTSRATEKAIEKARRLSQWERWAIESNLNASSATSFSPIPRLNFAPVRRMQQISTFLETTYPIMHTQCGGLDESSMVRLLTEVDLSHEPFGSACDALCWAQLAAKTGQEATLLHRAAAAYGRSLSSLTDMIRERPLTAAKVRLMLFGASLASLYERMVRVPGRWDAWMAHLRGICALIMHNGSKVIDLERSWDASLFYLTMMTNLIIGVALRQPGPYEFMTTPGFVDFHDSVTPSLSLLLYCKSIPTLLSRVDKALNGSSGRPELRSIFRSIISLRSCLFHWSRETSPFAGELPPVLDTDDPTSPSPIFHTLDTMETFGSCFAFDTTKPAESFGLYAMSDLILECTLLRLIHFRPDYQFLTQKRPNKRIEADASRSADGLCRSLEYFCRTASVGNISYARAMAQLALNFFLEIGESGKVDWCRRAEEAIRAYEATFPHTQPAGMAGLDGLSEAVASVGSYRAKALGLKMPAPTKE